MDANSMEVKGDGFGSGRKDMGIERPHVKRDIYRCRYGLNDIE